MDVSYVKQEIRAAFAKQELLPDSKALTLLVKVVDQRGLDCLASVVDAIEAGETTRVSEAQVQEVINNLYGDGMQTELIQVISAFQVPRILYDPIRKSFYPANGRQELFGTAQDQRDVYLNRYYLLHQRLRRMKMFCRPVIVTASVESRQYCELTELKALLGEVGKTRYVMGCITQMEEGRFYLEDLSAALPLDISAADTGDGLFTENSIVVAEGELQHSGVFVARALGLPPLEPRDKSLAAAKGLDFFGGQVLRLQDQERAAQWEQDREDDRIIVLAHVWLDKPDVLDKLHTIFSGYEALDTPPSVFVLMGNFQSVPCSSGSTRIGAIRDNFTALAALIHQHPRIKERSKFVFVPGPGDLGPADVLPRPPLPAAVTAELREQLPSAVFATNPCRIRYCTQEIVLFRDDLEHRMRRQCLLPPKAEDGSAAAMFKCLCYTLLQQSHLSPVPLEKQPVYWQLDHALWLYPTPQALIIADSVPPTTASFQGCQCINPGSLLDGAFAAYCPSSREAELCDLPPPE